MNRKTKIIYAVLIPIALLTIAFNLFAGTEVKINPPDLDIEIEPIYRIDGTVDFQIRTTTHYGQYAPRHCLAIWICDGNDQFVRTLVRRAWTYRQHLVKWNAMTGGNYTNALITGASLNSHTTHNIEWDCTDMNGNSLPNGYYRVYVEFTENNSANGGIPDGPWTYVEFYKGTTPVNITPAGNQYFHDLELIFTPAALPLITIDTPSDGFVFDTLPLTIEFSTENFDPLQGDGSVGIYVNNNLVYQHYSLDDYLLDDFPEGDNILTLRLLDLNGNPFDPFIEDSITLTYSPISAEEVDLGSADFELSSFPNPFNSATTISFELTTEKHGNTEIGIYNMKGRKVKTLYVNPGGTEGSIIWNGDDENGKPVSPGVYLYKLHSGELSQTKKMINLR